MTKSQKRLTLALDTANDWSSDLPDGINLLSLGTTRKLHDESHRQGCITQIQRDIAWNRTYTPHDTTDVNQPDRDIPVLENLLQLVQTMPIKQEWLSNRDYSRFSEILYRELK